jgi:hypothetical protein
MQHAGAWFAALVSCAAFSAGCHQQQAATPQAANAAAANAAPTAPPPPTYSGPMAQVPAGQRFVVRMEDDVDSHRMSPGQRFKSSLEGALLDANGKVIVPAGTPVLGTIMSTKKAGNVAGKSELEIAFTDLQINGVLIPIQSQGVKAVGEGSGGGTIRKVGAGALIGGAFGGGSGAAKGAAVGGAVALLSKGKEVRVPAGSILELTLAAPVKVPVADESAGATPMTEEAPPTDEAAAEKAAPQDEDAQKACVKKLMDTGFSADEAVASCKKGK